MQPDVAPVNDALEANFYRVLEKESEQQIGSMSMTTVEGLHSGALSLRCGLTLQAMITDIDQDSKWIPPPEGLLLSNLQVYVARKNSTKEELFKRWLREFMSNRNVRSLRKRPGKPPALPMWARHKRSP
ncbi:unnamed protein product [Penicillium bialowiezense]